MPTSKAEVLKYRLNNGRFIPGLALGTYLGFDQNGIVESKNKELFRVVEQAIDIGYRHFDTAAVYTTESDVGGAIRKKLDDGAVSRDEIYVTTKLWNTRHRQHDVEEALNESLKRLGLDYVDLYLMHWPIALNENYTQVNIDYLETWKGMEEMYKTGLAKSIGVSNFNKTQLSRLINAGEVKPAVLQIEIHPNLIQTDLIDFCREKDIVVMAYSPFGSLVQRFGLELKPKIDDPILVEIAEKYRKTTPQVVLRWLIDRGTIPIPKTVNPKRLQENIDIFDFKLSKTEIEAINTFDSGHRFTLPSFWQNHPEYPFDKVTDTVPDPFLKD